MNIGSYIKNAVNRKGVVRWIGKTNWWSGSTDYLVEFLDDRGTLNKINDWRDLTEISQEEAFSKEVPKITEVEPEPTKTPGVPGLPVPVSKDPGTRFHRGFDVMEVPNWTFIQKRMPGDKAKRAPKEYGPPKTKELEDDREAMKDRLFYVQRIKNILRDNKTERKVKNHRSGDLCFKKIYKVRLTDRLFEKKGIISKKNYNICLCVDVSGSMRGPKVKEAAKAARILTREFQNMCSLRIQSFNHRMLVYKHYDDVNLNELQITKMGQALVDENHTDYAAGNFDSYNIMKAVESFKKRDGVPIIVVLSDGEPAADMGQWPKDGGPAPTMDLGTHLKAQVNLAIKRNIQVIGIGIMSTSVEHYYPIHEVIGDSKDIYPAIMKTLAKSIRRL